MSAENNNERLGINWKSNIEMNIPIHISHYTIDKLIIETVKSVVLAAHDNNSQKKVAIKCVPYSLFTLNPTQVQNIQSVNDTRIIKVIDSFPYPDTNPRFYAIVMPRAVGDLIEYMQNNNNLQEQFVCSIMRNLLEAVHILHSKGIWHQNIKPENILVMCEEAKGPAIAIADFCHSIIVSTPTYNGTPVGTLFYAAPELLEISNGILRFKRNVECLFLKERKKKI